MNVYALFPLIATIAYIPLLLTTIGTRPLQKRHVLFIAFMISAMMWSLTDIFLRGNFYPQHYFLLLQLIIITAVLTVVQFYCFVSSFFSKGQGRWLPLAYAILAAAIIMLVLGAIPDGVIVNGEKLYLDYGNNIIFLFIPLLVLAGRTIYVFCKRMKTLDNPVIYNQLLSLLLSIGSLTIFSFAAILPWGREYPVVHIGNIANALILSYAVIRHRLVDIRLVLRQGTAWILLSIVGVASFWLLLMFFHVILDFKLELITSITVTISALAAAIFIYYLRNRLFKLITRVFQGPTYNCRQKLLDFTEKIHNIFSLKQQGGEMLYLMTKAMNIKRACLLFPEPGSEDFITQFTEPKNKENPLSALRLRAGNPIIKFMEREQKTLQKESLNILPAFLGLWPQEKEEIATKEIEIFVPLISRDRLVAILVVGEKQSGRYTLEELNIVEDVTSRVAVSIEKEYLREQLREREEELQVINASSNILSSSMDIQEIFENFTEELKKVIDVVWASIVLADDADLCCIAVSSSEGLTYKVGDRIPMEGTGTGWVVTNKRSFIEPDLSQGMHFNTGENFYQQGFRTLVYIPLISKGKAIGTLIVASRQGNAYNQRQIKLLEQLASQIAMPLEHTQLYAKAEQKARVDELTGLFNRRSLDEILDNEISRHSRYGGVFSLAILDLDSFKVYNDTYGHLKGDKLLRQVGQIIKESIRNADSAFRYGGDEFALLLPLTDIDAGLQVVERVRKRVAEELCFKEVSVTTSIGLASWPDDGITHTDIIASADVMLYRAKHGGGNRSIRPTGTSVTHQAKEVEDDADGVIDSNMMSVIYGLSETIDSKSYDNNNHSRKVADRTLALAKQLKMGASEISKLEVCALLHDAGKISIGEEILNKKGALTPAEKKLVKSHPELGVAIAERIPKLTICVEGIRHHHESYDGTGYPDGLKGEDIPLEARILAVADTYVILTSDTVDSEGLTQKAALSELQKRAGKQLDPHLVEQFISVFKGERTIKTKKMKD